MEINRLLARLDLLSRRKANELIKSGKVKVNGHLVSDFNLLINLFEDKISLEDREIFFDSDKYLLEKKIVLVLNKPEGVLTTALDPFKRKTVFEFFPKKIRSGIHSMGRLDKDTRGVLLFTNDGRLTSRLTHPRGEIKKIYSVELNKKINSYHLKKIKAGIILEDGFIKVDQVTLVAGNSQQVELELHSGRNRIIRRIFKALGYQVTHLERLSFAGITHRGLKVGQWRYLQLSEINKLRGIYYVSDYRRNW